MLLLKLWGFGARTFDLLLTRVTVFWKLIAALSCILPVHNLSHLKSAGSVWGTKLARSKKVPNIGPWCFLRPPVKEVSVRRPTVKIYG